MPGLELKRFWEAFNGKRYSVTPPLDILCHLAVASRAKCRERISGLDNSILTTCINLKFSDPELENLLESPQVNIFHKLQSNGN